VQLLLSDRFMGFYMTPDTGGCGSAFHCIPGWGKQAWLLQERLCCS